MAGNSLQTRFDSAIAEGRRATTDTFWVAYQIPVRPGVSIDSREGGIDIRSSRSLDGIEYISSTAQAQRVGIFLLIRKSDASIEKVRLVNLGEDFQVRDRKVYWIGDPAAQESVAFLTAFVDKTNGASSLLMTISLHPDPYASDTLLRIARNSTSTNAKKNAIFWLGQSVSRQMGEELEKIAKDDPDVEVQKQVVFALSQRNNDESIPALIRIAKEHPSAAVRKQAVFWLGQKRDPRVLEVFEQMLKK